MEYKVTISPKADQDLDEIRACIAAENPAAAIKFVQHLVQKAGTLSRLPDRGHSIRSRPGALFIVYKSYLIVYRTAKNGRRVRILRFYHAARDLGRLRPGDL